MKYLVEALDVYEKLNIKDSELKTVPKAEKQWKVSKKRLDVLLGNNDMKLCFVKYLGEVEKKSKKTKKNN